MTADGVSTLPGPDGCPFHHLAPAARVVTRHGRYVVPCSAELACQDWHDGIGLRAMVADLLTIPAHLVDAAPPPRPARHLHAVPEPGG